jgi:hypothetical protein
MEIQAHSCVLQKHHPIVPFDICSQEKGKGSHEINTKE